jgi:retron-type reverse transcriptase
LVRKLQNLLTRSTAAKFLAVRRVTSNRGRKTPGVDGSPDACSESVIENSGLEMAEKKFVAQK